MGIGGIVEQVLGLKGSEAGTWQVDRRHHGPFAPLLHAAPTPDGWHLVSSPLTRTEWWTCFIPTSLCPRFGGLLEIPDAYAADCLKERCRDACGAEDGFVELRANRFRLDVDAALIDRRFPYLHEFLARAERLVEAANAEQGLSWHFARHQDRAYLQAKVTESALCDHLAALGRLFPLLSGVTGRLDVERLGEIDFLALDLDQEHDLLRLARHYAEVESLRWAAEQYLEDLVRERGGVREGIEFKLPGGLRYLLTTYVECFQGDKAYMGRVEFRRGLAEIRHFVATTMGGGRW